jgi:hypothetical protein
MPTTAEFWSQMGAFNEATLPVQIALSVLAITLTCFVFAKPSARLNTLTSLFFSFAFAWNGIVFFLIFAWSVASVVFGVLFIVMAVLFALDIFKKKIDFRPPARRWQRNLTILLVLLVFLYPVIGMALGHYYPKTCMPMAPCPLTVFAIALVSAAIPKVDKKVYVFLLIWAIIGLPKCLGALNCYEDCVLFAAGIYGLVLLVKSWKQIGARAKDGQEAIISEA